MLRNTEKMKSSSKTVSVHKRFINLNNSTLERKVMKTKWKIFAGIKFCGGQKVTISQVFIFAVDLISARENLYCYK